MSNRSKRLTATIADPFTDLTTFRMQVMEVTPALAQQWIDQRSRNNRRCQPGHVEMLTREIAAKRRLLTHEGIAFDREGYIADGQHTLHAIVKAGAAVQIAVFFGLNPDAIMVLNQGRPRSPGDMLAIFRGRKYTAMRVAVVRLLMSIELGRNDYKASIQDLFAGDTKHNEALEWFFAAKAGHGLWYAPFVAALVYAYERQPNETDEFLKLVINPVGLKAGSPVIATLNMISAKTADPCRGGAFRFIWFRKMLRGVAAYAAREKLKTLQDRDTGLRHFAKYPSLV